MDLPIRTFWLMNSSIGRLLAEKDLRTIPVLMSRNGGGNLESVRRNLILEMGDTGKLKGGLKPVHRLANEERDEEGFNQLRALAAMM